MSSILALLCRFFTGLGLVLTGQEANCDWCSYLTCVPTSLWDCNNTSPTGGVGAPVCQVRQSEDLIAVAFSPCMCLVLAV